MQLDTRLPLMAAQQPAMQFQPETRLESLGKIAPAINAMRQMQSGQQEEAEALRKRQAYQEFQSEVTKAFPGGVQELARVFMTKGTTPQHFEVGQKLMQAFQEQREREEIFGRSGAQSQATPTAMPAPAPVAMTQARVSEVSPEMAFYGASGGQPANAMMAMETPAPAMPTAPTSIAGALEYGGKKYSSDQVARMLQSSNAQLQQLGRAISDANKPQRETTPEKLRLMQGLGYPMTQEGFAAFEAAQRAPTAQSEISKLQSEFNALPANDPRRNALQARINMLTTRPEPVQVNVNQQLEKKEQQEKGGLNVRQFEEISKTAKSASRILPSLETQERILNAGFQTGFGTAAKKAGASLLSALGVPEAESFASNAETFVAAMNQAVLQRQLEQKGTQTQADADRITATGAQLGNTVQGNRFIISVAKAQLKRDISQSRFWEDYWRKNKTYEGAEEAWQSGLGGKSLFDAPELREFVQATAPARATTGAGAGAGATPRSSGGGVDRSNPLLR